MVYNKTMDIFTSSITICAHSELDNTYLVSCSQVSTVYVREMYGKGEGGEINAEREGVIHLEDGGCCYKITESVRGPAAINNQGDDRH